jgi:hypothetical protein
MSDNASERQYEVSLLDDERDFLIQGLYVWGGSTRMTLGLATALGFLSVTHLYEQTTLLAGRLEARDQLDRKQWAQIVALTEIGFSSAIFGAGGEWSVDTGIDDDESLILLRRVQTKFPDFSISG